MHRPVNAIIQIARSAACLIVVCAWLASGVCAQVIAPAQPASQTPSATGSQPLPLPANPPAIAPNYETPQRPLPSVERVGVDVIAPLPLTLDEAIVKQARAQADSNRRQVARGTLAPIDVIEADAQVKTFEQNVYGAQEGVARAENALKTMLLADRTAEMWSQALLPVTPVDLEAPRVALTEAVSAAMTNRLELAELDTGADINKINTRYYRDQTKPQVDLIASYASNGLAGRLNQDDDNPLLDGIVSLQERVNQLSAVAGLPALPPTLNTSQPNLICGYGQSLTQLLAQNNPTVRVGVRVSLTFRVVALPADERPGHALETEHAHAAVIIPENFDRDLRRGLGPEVQWLLDGADANTATIMRGHAAAITQAFNAQVVPSSAQTAIVPRVRFWFNPGRDSDKYSGPGIFAVGLALFPPLLAALALSREGEQKTILQVYVSSISAHEYLLG